MRDCSHIRLSLFPLSGTQQQQQRRKGEMINNEKDFCFYWISDCVGGSLYLWTFVVSVLIVWDELIGTTTVKIDGMSLTETVFVCAHMCVPLDDTAH